LYRNDVRAHGLFLGQNFDCYCYCQLAKLVSLVSTGVDWRHREHSSLTNDESVGCCCCCAHTLSLSLSLSFLPVGARCTLFLSLSLSLSRIPTEPVQRMRTLLLISRHKCECLCCREPLCRYKGEYTFLLCSVVYVASPLPPRHLAAKMPNILSLNPTFSAVEFFVLPTACFLVLVHSFLTDSLMWMIRPYFLAFFRCTCFLRSKVSHSQKGCRLTNTPTAYVPLRPPRPPPPL
jgi:hypothetical protein